MEKALVIPCQKDELLAIYHEADKESEVGVLIIVGGPQYRVGSHRQFVLLARHLAKKGIPVMRFDYRGMGDSSGETRNFEQIDQDIRATINYMMQQTPSIKQVVLWGLCDAASASILYAFQDQRVKGMVLLNPWFRTQAGEVKAMVKYYYWQRFLSSSFWHKVFRGEFSIKRSLQSIWSLIHRVKSEPSHPDTGHTADLPDRLAKAMLQFKGDSLFILSAKDLTAQEFKDSVKNHEVWKKIMSSNEVTVHEFVDANHTFASSEWRLQVADITGFWIKSLPKK